MLTVLRALNGMPLMGLEAVEAPANRAQIMSPTRVAYMAAVAVAEQTQTPAVAQVVKVLSSSRIRPNEYEKNISHNYIRRVRCRDRIFLFAFAHE